MGKLAVFVDEVLAKIPRWDIAIPTILAGVGEPFIQGALIVTLDVYLFKHLEGHAVIFLAKLLNIVGCTRLLTHKLVARETKHDYIVFVLIVECLPIGVLWGIPAF